MCFRQLFVYREYLSWGGLNYVAISNYVKYFGAITVLLILSLYGCIGLITLLKNMKRRASSSGDIVTVIDIENKNNESITYLFTYVIPFVFQDLSDISNIIAVSTLLIVTYFIYINSTLILVNPTISMKYALYQIEYMENTNKTRKGMILTENHSLEEGEIIIIKNIGYKLFYAINHEVNNE